MNSGLPTSVDPRRCSGRVGCRPALRRAHSIKADLWGIICVLQSRLRYRVEGGGEDEVLDPTRPGRIRPQEYMRSTRSVLRMQVDFYDHEPQLNWHWYDLR